MEGRLKTLKVPELKQILTKASVSIPAKANKADLIKAIIAAPAAVEAYNAQFPPEKSTEDDLLSPPEEVNWNEDATPAEPAVPQVEPSKAVPQPEKPAVSTTTPAAPATQSSEDIELQKRKARAERFGIALVEPAKPKNQKKANAGGPDNADKLKARAERFGVKNAPAGKRKRGNAPVEETVDPEELERRKKRAERFGLKA